MNFPQPFPPPWASAFGDDPFGLWVEVSVRGVHQRLRWIAPGEFQMGSPGGEGGWSEERPQHVVRITQGYWLADTACTQAFWLAVVGGGNTSRFLDDSGLPVENVSWTDIAQRFLPAVQAALGTEVHVELPSEAQWEYACRAGTKTAFSFGDTITPEQVNYDGNLPYGKAAKALFRHCTVPVASLPANLWGLYEMHGNVWEWCRDGHRPYTAGPISDPEGLQGVASGHALRGGSWIDAALDARSAVRGRNDPGLRSDRVGFRWCLRSSRPAHAFGPETALAEQEPGHAS